jgi:uncharacterized protein
LNINLSVLKTSFGDSIGIDTVIPPFSSENGHTSDVSVKGEIRNNAGRLEIQLTLNTVFYTECSRCLEPVSFKASYECNDRIVFEESDEYISLKSDDFNLDEYVYEELSIRLPYRLLCKDDCKGLCPICGNNLNLSQCGCTQDNIDPRLEVLKQLLDKKEE